MGTIVQKYGGSSVSTPTKLCQVARRVVETRRQGHRVVVVVSAMGDTTNQLLGLAHEVSPEPERRELDMLLTVGERISMSLLSMAIQDLGAPAVSFTGSQSGIITTDNHTNAKIIKVVPTRVLNALDDHKIVIIAGFQGVSHQLEITSLGRGGSDTTAVAMAAALDADYVEICSDVDGVYSADPRISGTAERLDYLSYDEMQSLSDSGAKVLNAEAVEWARRSGVEVRCVATADPRRRGTSIREVISDPQRGYTQPQISAVTHHPGLLRVWGNGVIPDVLMAALTHWGCADATFNQIYGGRRISMSTSEESFSATHDMSMRDATIWEGWIPLLNLYNEEQLMQELYQLGALGVERGWSWVTLVGRGLLGVSPQQLSRDHHSARRDESEESRGDEQREQREQNLVTWVSALLDEAQLNATVLHATPEILRWVIALDEAPRAVRLVHDALVTPCEP